MRDVKIKICGLMREEDVEFCIRNRVDIIGFVVDYPVTVPWNLDRERAKELIDFFRKCAAENGSDSEVSIVSGGSSESLTELVHFLKPDYLQMHYKETADDISTVKKAVADVGTKLIKTIPNSADEIKRQSGEEGFGACGRTFEEAGADILLVDARGPENAASRSSFLDAELYKEVRDAVSIPVMAAGGITPDNIEKVIQDINPDMVDIMTGVEESFGVKSHDKIEQIINLVKMRGGK